MYDDKIAYELSLRINTGTISIFALFSFAEHDNRDEQLRRVHFKHGTRYMPNKPNHQGGGGNERRGGKKQQKNWEHVIKSHLEDEDIDMGSQSQGGRFHAVKNRKGGGFNRVNSPAPRGHAGTSGPPMRPKLLEGPTNWYKVTLKQGANYDKEYCLKALLGHVAPETFIPINVSILVNILELIIIYFFNFSGKLRELIICFTLMISNWLVKYLMLIEK